MSTQTQVTVPYVYHQLVKRFHQCRVPYTPHRISNIIVRLNTRMRLPFVASFLLCFVLWWGVKIHSCFSYVLSWQGLLPMQVYTSVRLCMFCQAGCRNVIRPRHAVHTAHKCLLCFACCTPVPAKHFCKVCGRNWQFAHWRVD